jgi:hypothetical protein
MGYTIFDIDDQNRQRPLADFPDARISATMKSAVERLQSETGVLLDPYGTTVLYPDHMKLLLAGLGPADKEFRTILESAIASDTALVFEGD